jgi:hypothetical protein
LCCAFCQALNPARRGVYVLHKLLAFPSTRPPRNACSPTITVFGDTDALGKIVTAYIHHTYVHTSPILAWVVGQCDVVSAPRSCTILRGVPCAGRPIGKATILATDLECALSTCHLSVWAEIYCFRSALEFLLFLPASQLAPSGGRDMSSSRHHFPSSHGIVPQTPVRT